LLSSHLQLIRDALPPARWTGEHVGLRLSEAMRTLRLLPPVRVAGFRNSWPRYVHEFEDLLGQQQQGELELTQRLQNRVRLVPSLRDVTQMDSQSHGRPRFSAGHAELVVAVNMVALAHALDRDCGWVARRRGGMSTPGAGDTTRAAPLSPVA
jgi:hypothetical protein